ncbi:hypothetical protein UB43_27405 [Pseudomonas sp. 21]|nr:hypothetical protein UB43_27405 [Pseudomonas sp. 21]
MLHCQCCHTCSSERRKQNTLCIKSVFSLFFEILKLLKALGYYFNLPCNWRRSTQSNLKELFFNF